MSDTVFTKVDYDVGSLVKYIELGKIGLPNFQRPFVWKNAKVRNPFDSPVPQGLPGLFERLGPARDEPDRPLRLCGVGGQHEYLQRRHSLSAIVGPGLRRPARSSR